MKKIFVYSFAALSLLFASCAKSEVELPAAAEGEGSVSLRILADTRAEEGAYDAFDYYTIRIYNAEGGLIRKYAPVFPMPETLSLLAGSYSIDIEAGDMSKATFTNKSYHGTQDFAVMAGQKTAVTVSCKLLNAQVSVEYGETLTAFEAGYSTTVAMGEDELVYNETKTGYFLPETAGSEVTWTFAGVHPEKGKITKSGTLTVKPGYHYTLRLNYSEDAKGLLSFTLEVEEPTAENGGDQIIFSPEPIIKGDGFDMSTPQKFYNTTKTILLTSPNDLTALTLEMEGQTYDLAGTSLPNGIAVTKTDNLNWTVAISDAFFSSLPGGDHKLLFTATDVEGGTGKAEATFTTQGIVPVTAGDYDLWLNTASIRVKVLDPAISSVGVKYRKAGGEWTTLPATRTDDETFTATVAPEWTEDTSLGGEKIYRPNPATGIFANASYEAKAVIGGTEKETVAAFTTAVDQPIPYGDMEDGSLSCFGSDNMTNTFWGSGNNSFTSSLCKQVTFSGMGGAYCAKMTATSALNLLAAGNLFTGTFYKPSTQGTVYFGKDYDWKARPTALRLKYYAQIGNVELTKYKDETGNDPIAKGQPDKGRIYVAIVDWETTHNVSSGTSAPSGMWDPEMTSSVAEGAIIGYGSQYLTGTTAGDQMVTIDLPISFYDKVAKPSKAYKIVIACSTSAYGDYMCGNDKNVLYVDDFEWVY